MRVLEARFHANRGAGGGFVVVAHVVWERGIDREPPRVRPAAAFEGAGQRAPMLAKLRFLVDRSAPDAFERLQALKSQHWSFVEVAAALAGP
jgi:hypothetical protein